MTGASFFFAARATQSSATASIVGTFGRANESSGDSGRDACFFSQSGVHSMTRSSP